MDAHQFDILARSLAQTGSRRRAAAAVLGSTLGFLGLSHLDEATAGGACKPACSECQTCQKGKCHKTKHGKKCKKGTCTNTSDDTPCNGTGKCLQGTCNVQPMCLQFGDLCPAISPQDCCSGSCPEVLIGAGQCLTGAAGARCLTPTDCTSGSCVGFRCA
jgi:hypothetical protein